MQVIEVVIEKSSDSYGAYATNVDGIYSAGDTVEECQQSIQDAIDTILEYYDSDQIPPEIKGDYELNFSFDF